MGEAIYSCALCGYVSEERWADPEPVAVTEPHRDPRDGLVCLRSQLERSDWQQGAAGAE